MNLIVATVEHSGTMALLRLLDSERRGMTPLEESVSGFRFCHLYDHVMGLLLETDHEIITTDRDPVLIRASWVRRGRDLAELDRQLANRARLLERKPFVVTIWR